MNPTIKKVLVDNLRQHLEEAGKRLVFDPVSSDKMLAAFEQTLQRFVGPEQDIRGHIVVTSSLHDPNIILCGPKDDAPRWVFELFEKIQQITYCQDDE